MSITMKGDVLSITGKALYAVVQKPRGKYDKAINGSNEELGTEYSAMISVSDSDFQGLLKVGMSPLTTHKSVDGDPLKYVTFRAPKVKITAKGRKVISPDLKVVDKEGNAITDLVGNGSTVQAIVEIERYANTAALRLRAIIVEDLVSFEEYDDDGVSDINLTKEVDFTQFLSGDTTPQLGGDLDNNGFV